MPLCALFYWLLNAEAKSLLFTQSIDMAQELFSVRTPVWKAPVEESCPEIKTRPSTRAVRPQRWLGIALNLKWAVLEAILVRGSSECLTESCSSPRLFNPPCHLASLGQL